MKSMRRYYAFAVMLLLLLTITVQFHHHEHDGCIVINYAELFNCRIVGHHHTHTSHSTDGSTSTHDDENCVLDYQTLHYLDKDLTWIFANDTFIIIDSEICEFGDDSNKCEEYDNLRESKQRLRHDRFALTHRGPPSKMIS